MPYYHIVIENKSSNNKQLIFHDLNKEEVYDKFITPYLEGKDLFLEGEILPIGNLSKVAIVETERLKDNVLKEVQKDSRRTIDEINREPGVTFISQGWGNFDEEIEDYANNVTTQFLNSGPGEGTKKSRFKEIMHNPWVVKVGAGIILIIIGFIAGS